MKRSLLLFSGLLLLLAVKGDGRFPLPATIPEPAFQVYVLGLTLLFGVGLVCLAQRRSGRNEDPPPLRLAAAISGLFLTLDCAVLLLEARRYVSFGYRWRPAAAMLVCLLPACAFAWLAMRRRAVNPGRLLLLAAGAHGALCLFACACFPLAPARSDMVPLLVRAGHELLSGHDPYALYHLSPGTEIRLTYLPGLLFSYLPAALLRIDPRLVGLVYTVAAARLLYVRGGSAAAAFLSVFLVDPYLVYRHDAYLAPFWLLLAILWAVLTRPRPLAIAASCGVLCLTSQLLLIPACAAAIFGFKRYGRAAMLRSLVPAALVCGATLGAFLLADSATFAAGTIGHWKDAVNVESLGIAYWLLSVLPASLVHVAQALAVIVILLLPRSRRQPAAIDHKGCAPESSPQPFSALPAIDPERPSSALATASLALFAFAAMNTVTWTYFYLPVLFLAMLSQLERLAFEAG